MVYTLGTSGSNHTSFMTTVIKKNRLLKFLNSHRFKDQIRSSLVDVLWISLTLADGNLFDFLAAFYGGDYQEMTFSAIFALATRLLIRSVAFYVMIKLKQRFPKLELPVTTK